MHVYRFQIRSDLITRHDHKHVDRRRKQRNFKDFIYKTKKKSPKRRKKWNTQLERTKERKKKIATRRNELKLLIRFAMS